MDNDEEMEMEEDEEVEEEVPEEEPTPEPEPEPEPKQADRIVYTSRGAMKRMPDGSLEPANLD